MKNKLFYICYYGDESLKDRIVTYPSVWSKIDYIVDCLKDEYDVEIVSVARSIKGKFKGFTRKYPGKTLVFLSSFQSKYKKINKLFILIHWFKILFYLLKNVKKNDKVLVYHSLDNLWWLKIYSKVFKRKFYLEIEDVFSLLDLKNKKFITKEFSCFSCALGCICVNDLVFNSLTCVKNKIISYGKYDIPPEFNIVKNNNKVKLVYAGVIEQQRNAAFLAVKAMNYLQSNQYSLDVLGFGTDNDIHALNELIKDTIMRTGNEDIAYRGIMSGDEYNRFLQSCDIGLSTHMYDDKNMLSADNTFPSKILVYLGNNLRVVAQRIKCLEECYMKDYIYLYESADAYSLAECIKRIDFNHKQSSRELLLKMDNDFRKSLIDFFAK